MPASQSLSTSDLHVDNLDDVSKYESITEKTSEPVHSDSQNCQNDDDLLVAMMSQPSSKIVKQLLGFQKEYNRLVSNVNEIEDKFNSEDLNTRQKFSAGKCITELSQVEAKVNKLQMKGVDSVETADLNSGKEIARRLRKEINRGLDGLFDRMQDLFLSFKERQKVEREELRRKKEEESSEMNVDSEGDSTSIDVNENGNVVSGIDEDNSANETSASNTHENSYASPSLARTVSETARQHASNSNTWNRYLGNSNALDTEVHDNNHAARDDSPLDDEDDSSEDDDLYENDEERIDALQRELAQQQAIRRQQREQEEYENYEKYRNQQYQRQQQDLYEREMRRRAAVAERERRNRLYEEQLREQQRRRRMQQDRELDFFGPFGGLDPFFGRGGRGGFFWGGGNFDFWRCIIVLGVVFRCLVAVFDFLMDYFFLLHKITAECL